jgi:hypothetical protein
MLSMTRSLAMLSGLALALLVTGAAAQQLLVTPGSQFHPLPPPPTPNVPVPVTPMFGPRPQPNYAPAPRPSFSDRVVRCLQDGAAAGLGPSARSAYSGACANQQ